MSLEERLDLDLSDALAGVADLEARITAVASSGADAVASSFAGLGATIGAEIAAGIQQGGQEGASLLQAELSALTATVAVTFDTDTAGTVIASLSDVEIAPKLDLTGAEEQFSQLSELAGEQLSAVLNLVNAAAEAGTAAASSGSEATPQSIAGDVIAANTDQSAALATLASDQLAALAELVQTVAANAIASASIDPVTVPVEADLTAFETAVDNIGDELDLTVTVNDTTALDELDSLTQDRETTIVVDDSQVADAATALDGIGGDQEATITVDTTEIDAAATAIGDIPTEITVEADASGLTPVSAELDDIATKIDEINATEVAPSGDAGSIGSAAGGGAAASAAATGQDGLDRGAAFAGALAGGGFKSFAEQATIGRVAGLGFTAAVGGMVDMAINADASIRRFNNTLGDQAQRVLDLRDAVPGLGLNLSDLALKNGSSISSLRDGISTFAQLGRVSKATDDQIAQGGQGLVQLAAYVSAVNPKLGTAGDLIERLPLLLARGGPRLARFGIDAGSAAEKAAKALELFGKTPKELSNFEKQYVGIQIALDKVGDQNLAEKILGSFDTPLVKLRSLETQIKRVLTEAGTPLVGGVVETLAELAGPAADAVKLLGSVIGGVFSVVEPEARALGSLLQWIAELLDNSVVRGLLAAAGAGTVALKSMQLAARSVASLIDIAKNVAAAFRTAFSSVAALGEKGASYASAFRADGISGVAAEYQRAEASALGLAEAQATVVESYTDLNATLLGTAAYLADDAEAYDALTLAVVANGEAAADRIALSEATIAVMEAEAEVEKQLAIARSQGLAVTGPEAAENEALVAATEKLTIAKEQQAAASITAAESGAVAAEATAAASATVVVGAEEIEVASTGAAIAVETLAAAEEGAAVSMGALSTVMSVINPLMLAATVAVGGYVLVSQLLGDGAEEQAKAVNEATDAIHSYADALKLTDAQLADADQSTLRRRFQEDKDAVDALRASIKDLSPEATAALDAAGAFRSAGAAVRGDKEAQAQTRAAFVRSGEVSAGLIDTSDYENPLQKAIREKSAADPSFDAAAAYQTIAKATQDAWISTGSEKAAREAGVAAARAYGLGVDSVPFEVEKKGSYKKYEEQLKAQREAENAAIEAAKVDLTADDPLNVANLTYAASIGLLDRLTPKERAHAEELLRSADAAKTATQNEQVLAGIEDARTKTLAQLAFAGKAAITAGDAPSAAAVSAARALVASNGFDTLDESVQSAAKALVDYSDTAIQTANANGDLFATTGELAIGMGDLKGRLDTAADGFVNLLSKSQALAASTRNVDKVIRDIIPKTDELGTSLDETSAAFDGSQITADNYTKYLALLPKATQDAIEGRNQAVKKSREELDKSDPLSEGLIAERFARGEFAGGKPGSEQDQAEKSAEQKAAETRAAIEANQEALDGATRMAKDNATALADYFDTVGVAIRKESAEMLKNGATIDEVTAKIAQRRDELIATAEQAGLTDEQINKVLDDQRLLPSQVVIDLQESGVDKIVGAIERLATVMAGLDDISPKVANAIRGISDPTKQVEAFNKAIADLPEEEQTKLRLIYDVPDPEAFKAEESRKLSAGEPFRVGVQLGLDRDAALALDQEFADVIADLPGVSVKVTDDSVKAVQQFDDSIRDTVAKDYAIALDPAADPAAKAAAEKELKDLAAERDALIKAGIAPEELSVAEAELANLAKDRTIDFKTTLNGKPWTDYGVKSEYVDSEGKDREHQAERGNMPVNRRKPVDAKKVADDIIDDLFGGDGKGDGKGRGGHRSKVTPEVDQPGKKKAEEELDGLAKTRTAKVKPDTDDKAKKAVEHDRHELGKDIKPATKPKGVAQEDLDSVVTAATTLAARSPVHLRSVIDPPTTTPGSTTAAPPSSSGAPVGGRLTPQQATSIGLPSLSPRSGPTTRTVNGQQYRWDGTGWIRVYAQGGTTFADDDELIAARRRGLLDQSAFADPGGFSRQFAIRESSTQGEYLISRDPAYRARNQALTAAAADDLGVRLPAIDANLPTTIVAPGAAPQVNQAHPELAAAIRQLAEAVDDIGTNASPEGRPSVQIDQLTVVQSPDPVKSSREAIEDVRTAVFTGRPVPPRSGATRVA